MTVKTSPVHLRSITVQMEQAVRCTAWVLVAGEDSLLDDVASGNSIYLYENAGVIYGQVNNTTGIYDASGINAFTLTVNRTGDVTLDQIRAHNPTGGNASPETCPHCCWHSEFDCNCYRQRQ
jgi:hypothetical protein